MRLGKLAGAAVVILFTFTLNMASVFSVNPIMACDPIRTTGIGAVSFTDGNGNPMYIVVGAAAALVFCLLGIGAKRPCPNHFDRL